MRWQKALVKALMNIILAIVGGLLGSVITIYLYEGKFLYEFIVLVALFTGMLFFLYYKDKEHFLD
jgi:hypothetical protein